MGFLKKLFGDFSSRELKRIRPLCDKVLALENTYTVMTDEELASQTARFRERLAAGEKLDALLPEAFAVCREATRRVLETPHFPVQILGGIVLHQGRIAEMKTGEGKTQTVLLPAYLNALTGEGVHIVTVNEYLAARDSEWMGDVFRFLGLSVGLILHDMDKDARRAAYAADITYGTNNEFGFDYLRDNMVVEMVNKVQRGHAFAIVDEVDSILIDEARTPLIISGPGEKSTDWYERADAFAKKLVVKRVTEMDTKEDQEALAADADYIIDEKARTATLTQNGIAKAEKHFHIDDLMAREDDGVTMVYQTLVHHINQAIKANGVMRLDIDYVVRDDEIVIVDEHTGRMMEGRRYSEGLHQAIEAKEGVKVQRESRTLATITFQNYFRMYKKLSGMTGTAKTEETEFQQIYHLDVIEVPTNRPVIRQDLNDLFYVTEKAKLEAVVEQIVQCHERRQPVLVGTVSIEKSEQLSAMLKRRGIKHEVLNAKQHEREAQIVAQAGKPGAVTVATNMAGRGTDIKLGGNPEFMAQAELRRLGYSEEQVLSANDHGGNPDEETLALRQLFAQLEAKYKDEIKDDVQAVIDAGGLFIIGTERHESRRIDNQLRGRSGRQGDPGVSRFYLSAEDDLIRLFGGDRFRSVMGSLMTAAGEQALENKMLTDAVERAQRNVEARHFAARRDVISFDDVINTQRTAIYEQRDKVLRGENVRESIMKMIHESIENTVAQYTQDPEDHTQWNMDALRLYYNGWLCGNDDFRYTPQELEDMERSDLAQLLIERAEARYEEKESRYGEVMRELERIVLLTTVDRHWMDHIDSMDELKRGIHLRSYAQQDPVVRYRIEGFEMYEQMIDRIREETARTILLAEIRTGEELERKQIAKEQQAQVGGDSTREKRPVRKTAAQKVGRNDLCPCGSGIKYKKCCGANED
ncbi:MAG: preprotein translocase subunit SecA [Ruminococcaceae bacterium]|nr:preprotein translocase subunit SecA [Oscillospiraceae bacterium]